MKVKKYLIYSTLLCGYCKMLKSFLEEQNFPYEEVDVSVNKKAAQEMVAATQQMGVPVSKIVYEDESEKYIVGFNPARIKAAIAEGPLRRGGENSP